MSKFFDKSDLNRKDVDNIVSETLKNSDDGECDIEIRAGMRNTSDDFIARGQITLKLMDQRDAQIEESQDYEAFPAKSGKVFQPSLMQCLSFLLTNTSNSPTC